MSLRIFQDDALWPEFSQDAEVYKLNGFTVNLFINKGFNRITQ